LYLFGGVGASFLSSAMDHATMDEQKIISPVHGDKVDEKSPAGL
jgi:hypothetical protein